MWLEKSSERYFVLSTSIWSVPVTTQPSICDAVHDILRSRGPGSQSRCIRPFAACSLHQCTVREYPHHGIGEQTQFDNIDFGTSILVWELSSYEEKQDRLAAS